MKKNIRSELIQNYVSEGTHTTIFPFVSLSVHNRGTPPIPMIMNPTLSLLIQGEKILYISGKRITMEEDMFAFSSVDLPISVEIPERIVKENKAVSLNIELPMSLIREVIQDSGLQLEVDREKKQYNTVLIGSVNDALRIYFERIIVMLVNNDCATYIAELLRKELVYRLLSGEYGMYFFELMQTQMMENSMYHIIQWIRENYTKSVRVDDIASQFHLSVSGLQHKFKQVTGMSPIQYQKEIRLRESRRILHAGMSVTNTAMEVGYNSVSQFIREYKRVFGKTPYQDVKAIELGKFDKEL